MSDCKKIEDLLQELVQKNPLVHEVNHDNELMSIDEFAKYLRLSKSTIYKLKSTREIPCFKTGKILIFKRKDVDEWLKRCRSKSKYEIEMEELEISKKCVLKINELVLRKLCKTFNSFNRYSETFRLSIIIFTLSM